MDRILECVTAMRRCNATARWWCPAPPTSRRRSNGGHCTILLNLTANNFHSSCSCSLLAYLQSYPYCSFSFFVQQVRSCGGGGGKADLLRSQLAPTAGVVATVLLLLLLLFTEGIYCYDLTANNFHSSCSCFLLAYLQSYPYCSFCLFYELVWLEVVVVVVRWPLLAIAQNLVII